MTMTNDRSAVDLLYGIAAVLDYDTVYLWEKGHNADSLALEPSHTWNISGPFALSEKISFTAKAKCYTHLTCRVV